MRPLQLNPTRVRPTINWFSYGLEVHGATESDQQVAPAVTKRISLWPRYLTQKLRAHLHVKQNHENRGAEHEGDEVNEVVVGKRTPHGRLPFASRKDRNHNDSVRGVRRLRPNGGQPSSAPRTPGIIAIVIPWLGRQHGYAQGLVRSSHQ